MTAICFHTRYGMVLRPTSNNSGRARKTILYKYCQLFVRSYDFGTTPSVLERCTARQRRLLGDLGHEFRPGDFFYAPIDQEQILRFVRAR